MKDEKPFWPLAKDEVLEVGDVKVTNTQTYTEQQTEDSAAITTCSLSCVRESVSSISILSGTYEKSPIGIQI